jgi:hypothetical protein
LLDNPCKHLSQAAAIVSANLGANITQLIQAAVCVHVNGPFTFADNFDGRRLIAGDLGAPCIAAMNIFDLCGSSQDISICCPSIELALPPAHCATLCEAIDDQPIYRRLAEFPFPAPRSVTKCQGEPSWLTTSAVAASMLSGTFRPEITASIRSFAAVR